MPKWEMAQTAIYHLLKFNLLKSYCFGALHKENSQKYLHAFATAICLFFTVVDNFKRKRIECIRENVHYSLCSQR